ncbi:MAG TPA: hypothetical protein VM260_26895 [Pirellula sp.]|nr:hypothetical protein [Pirellula sp.]
MKLSPKRLLVVATAACFVPFVTAKTCEAGPWLDSLFGRRPPAYPVGAPVPINGQIALSPGGYSPASGYVPPSYANLRSPVVAGYGNYVAPPANNAPVFAPGFPQTVIGQLPTAAYDSQWARTPVTYYRPVTAFDPRYGTTVTSLQPCTSYQYQAQRQPVIAPRPLLGDYGLQANRWPSITGPGYNPTGLSNTAMYAPAVQPYQYIPNVGMPINNSAAAPAPLGAVGVSSGMPAITLPMTTIPYHPAPYNPTMPYNTALGVQQQSYYNGQNYNGQVVVNPAYTSTLPVSPNVVLPSSAVGSGVVPSAAWMPSTTACANEMCPQPSSTIPTPYVPGATSVTPVGPPTYSATPNPNYGFNSGIGQGLNVPIAPGLASPNGNPYANPYAAPPANILPPSSNLNDPESTRTPSLGSSGAANSTPRTNGSPFNVQKLPMVAIDRSPNSGGIDTPPSLSHQNGLLSPTDAFAKSGAALNEPSAMTPNMHNRLEEIPQTLAPRGNAGMQPLSAPDDFDSKPRWTPTLLDPQERTAMDRTSRPAPNRSKVDKEEDTRIRLRADGDATVLAVAIDAKKSNRNSIQLVSEVESKKSEAEGSSVIRFRPVTTLK